MSLELQNEVSSCSWRVSSVAELPTASFLSIARFSFLMSVAASTAPTKLLIFLEVLMYWVDKPKQRKRDSGDARKSKLSQIGWATKTWTFYQETTFPTRDECNDCKNLPRCSNVRVIGLLGISGYLRGKSWPTLSNDWKWMLVFMPMMMAGPVAFMSSCLSPLIRMKGLVTVLEVVTITMSLKR